MNNSARWALAQDLAPGDVVGLMLPNCAAYAALWLGIVSVRGVVALINPALTGDALAGALAAAQPRHVIADAQGAGAVRALPPTPDSPARIWIFGEDINAEPPDSGGAPVPDRNRRPLPTDTALLIFTSGTTGRPKAARVSHRRITHWSLWFAGLIDTQPEDRMYNCLPLFHSVGGVVAIGAMLTAGGAVVIRKRFSASRFWDDVVRHDCTLFQYIGELCRHLLHAPDTGAHPGHRLRLCCGNGLRGDVWEPFVARFQIPRILEFYASTEGNVSLYNVPGKPGAIGHVPGFLAHRPPVALARVNADTGALLRGPDGHCFACGPDEAGEALGPISTRAFEGYTDAAASEAKIARNVFAPGDAWYRTGDLMRRDAARFYYFIDRIGDNYRWKGETVATEEVSHAVRAAPGVRDAMIYGVPVPGNEGRAGMAALVVDAQFRLDVFRAHIAASLPSHAWPVFLRLVADIPDTATFKPQRASFVREGFASGDDVYVHDRAACAYVRLDRQSLLAGKLKI